MSYYQNLNLEQKKAVEFKEGPLLIVAGAGTGKTTVITERIGWLIKTRKLNPEQVLALTFTDKAAGEMEERVDKLLPYGYVDLWISTFHSFAQRILEQHGLDIGLPGDFKLLDQTQGWLMVRQNLEKFKLDYYRPLGNPTKFIHALIKHFSRCKDELVFPRDYLDYAEKLRLDADARQEESVALEVKRLEEVANAYHVYQQLLLDNNALDFGDLINYCLKLFKDRPQILKKYRDQFHYVLVDEFQDTNHAQFQLIKLLAEPRNNITVVGDDDQSIYAFRGSSISNILEFKKDFPKAEEVFLNTNYRSNQNILDPAYKFIQLNNPNRLEVKLKTKDTALSKKLKSALKGKGIIEHLHQESLDDEVAMVINKIQELYSQGDSSWNDFAILVRANDQANVFTAGLETAGLPFQFVASKGLYLKSVVMDTIAFLKMLDNYHESPAYFRLLMSPIVNLLPKDLINLTHLANKKSWSLYETSRQFMGQIAISEKSQNSLDKIISLIEKHASLAKEKSVVQVTLSFLEQSGYIKWIDKQAEQAKRETFNYLGQFYKKIKDFESSHDDKSIKTYLHNLDLELESGEQGKLQSLLAEEGPDTIKVMTVHQAKGLEFKYVFIVNLVDRRFPTTQRSESIELPDELVKEIIPEGDIHLQEERRLFYVAITRAKEGLFFTSAEDYGGQRKKKLSRFLSEIGLGDDKQQPATRLDAKRAGLSVTEGVGKFEKIKENQEQKARPPARDQLPAKFSFTQLKAFETCPLQYKYAHILKIPVKGKGQFSFGKTMHNTLHKFFDLIRERSQSKQAELFGQDKFDKSNKSNKFNKLDKLISLEELLKLYEAAWIDDWYESKSQKEEYYKKGREILKNFYNQLPEPIIIPQFLEKPFNVKIGERTIKGIIDRVDKLPDGSIEIIDYKTGKPKEEDKLSFDDKEQLLIYQIAATEVLKEKVSKLTFYYLDNNAPISFLGEENDLEKIKNKVTEEISQIETTDFKEDAKIVTPSLHKCKFCDFKDICGYKVI
ncbi:ATP-dependent helicase [Patescibacteria group bacterium]|nr:ATP-dependent helicase [Patescibacteria group bacterium]